MEDFVGAKITVHMPFLVAISAFREKTLQFSWTGLPAPPYDQYMAR